MSAALQGSATGLLDLSVGSVLRGVLEANASLALWMQWLALKVLMATRAATSSGPDLDSWMQDFSVTRLPAVAAQGSVTFGRYGTSTTAFIPVECLVKTADGSQSFSVAADATNAMWSPTESGYMVPIAVASATVPVIAQVAGKQGNVLANTIIMIASALVGIDTVTNANPISSGADAETDSALRTRFQSFLSSRSRGTLSAVGFAIMSLQQNLAFLINENVDASGAPRLGSFLVTIDDGSGSPPSALLASVATAVDAVRPIGSIFVVQPPVVITATVALTITTSQPSQLPAAIAAATNGITAHIDRLGIGGLLSITRIAQTAYGSARTIVNVNAVTINGLTTDLVPPANGVVKAGMVTVN
jgi:uncharacterized phage protein gp47/JayE